MKELLANMLTVTYFARDLHYRWKGPEFYAVHLLADRIADFGTASDDIKECFYLGFNRTEPPLETDIASASVEEYREIAQKASCPLCRASEALARTICLVESAKRTEGLPAGVHAILDGISQHAVTMRGLVLRTMPADGGEDRHEKEKKE